MNVFSHAVKSSSLLRTKPALIHAILDKDSINKSASPCIARANATLTITPALEMIKTNIFALRLLSALPKVTATSVFNQPSADKRKTTIRVSFMR